MTIISVYMNVMLPGRLLEMSNDEINCQILLAEGLARDSGRVEQFLVLHTLEGHTTLSWLSATARFL